MLPLDFYVVTWVLLMVILNFAEDLAGLKVRHGLDKVMEGAAVVLTLKDTNILVDGDLNDGMVLISTLAWCFVLQFCQFLETG
jgi:hypothetical protein